MINEKGLKIRNTYNNIKGYALYGISDYKLTKEEADVCLEALELQLGQIEKKEGNISE